MKGFSITGLILGIIATAAGAAAIVMSAIGLAKSRPREFYQQRQKVPFSGTFFSILFHTPSLLQMLRFPSQKRSDFWHLKQTGFLEKHHRMLYNK